MYIDNEITDYTFKTILIGDSGVGKSSFLRKYIQNNFESKYEVTIGVDFHVKRFKHKNFNIKLQIWDTAGQERFRSIITQYYRNTDIVLLFFDLTTKSSFLNINNWIDTIKKNLDNSYKIVLIGTKQDILDDVLCNHEKLINEQSNYIIDESREIIDPYDNIVTFNDIETFIKKNKNIPYICVSSKNDNNFEDKINLLFNEIVSEILIDKNNIKKRTNINKDINKIDNIEIDLNQPSLNDRINDKLNLKLNKNLSLSKCCF